MNNLGDYPIGLALKTFIAFPLFQETQQLFTIWVEFKHFCSILELVFILQIDLVILQSEDQKF